MLQQLDPLIEEEKEAWSRYHSATTGQPVDRYEEIEPWAWRQLQVRLLAIQRRRQARDEH